MLTAEESGYHSRLQVVVVTAFERPDCHLLSMRNESPFTMDTHMCTVAALVASGCLSEHHGVCHLT